jgi:hypothetical protein
MAAAILFDCSQGKEPAPTRGKAEAGEGSDYTGVDGTISEPANPKTVPLIVSGRLVKIDQINALCDLMIIVATTFTERRTG